ncbi:MAG: ribose 5-phosphate isomerase B [Acidobacteriota bacterium]|jgi:ribose 5-phosphate isomerase B|nr:ribose 5-phosphate isomerase B [Bryobacteraceae bacterium CoA2 C42]MCA2963766.1 ribose 5-phosphate isomerase B [Acidobacteriaceae bacterium]
MKIAIGSDHAGFELKEQLRETLRAAGYEVADLGTASTESTDYPDYAAAVARAVRDGQADKGILVCSSGVGMSIAANKIKGIRAALGTNPEEVSFVRRHNDANVLAIGAKYTGAALAGELVNLFLTTEFEGGRHQRRLDKIKVLEQTEEKE